jgi:hypothetical protein
VTEDHSLVIGGQEIKPQDFIDRDMQFETLSAPPPVVAQRLDLYEYLKGFKRDIVTDHDHGDVIECRFVLDETGEWIGYRNFRGVKQWFRRFYDAGSPEFHAFLRVLAAFITKGDCYLKGITGGTKDRFSLLQNDKKRLSDLKKDLLSLTKDTKLAGPRRSSSSGAFYLRNGAGMLPCLFGEIGGVGESKKRRLPSFVYELSGEDFEVFWAMLEGDGLENRDTYTTSSQQLAAGISFLLGQHGHEHSIRFRESKGYYVIRVRGDGSERDRWTTKVETRRCEGFVYDLEVEGAHTFVDGLGRVLLHNTDSLCTRAILPVADTLGALKLEKKMDWARFVAPKIYMGEGFELKKDGTWEPKRLNKAKGFSLGTGRDAFEKLGKIIGGDRIGVQRMTRLRELYRTQVKGQYTTAPFEMLVIKALTFEMLSKRFHYPDGETRPWSVEELKSGDCYPKGFDFDKTFLENLDTTTRAMMAAAV